MIIGFPFIFVSHIIVFLNDNIALHLLLQSIVLNTCFGRKGLIKSNVFFYEETFIQERTLGFMP